MRAKVTPELEKRIHELRTEGLTWRQIAAEVGLGHNTVGRVLNPEIRERTRAGSREYWKTYQRGAANLKPSPGRPDGRVMLPTWHGMKLRCLSQAYRHYRHYGGRGTTIYEPWIDDFRAYQAYIFSLPACIHGFSGQPPLGKCDQGCTIDRVNNDGNYEPGNPRWATKSEQMRNRRVSLRKTA